MSEIATTGGQQGTNAENIELRADDIELRANLATATQQPALEVEILHAVIQHASIWSDTEDEVSVTGPSKKRAVKRGAVYKSTLNLKY